MKMEPVKVLILNERLGLILNGANEFSLQPVVAALGLTVVHGWRIRSKHLFGCDYALIEDRIFPVRKEQLNEFVDLKTATSLPALKCGRVLDEASHTGGGQR